MSVKHMGSSGCIMVTPCHQGCKLLVFIFVSFDASVLQKEPDSALEMVLLSQLFRLSCRLKR